jgi:hypothetical protein
VRHSASPRRRGNRAGEDEEAVAVESKDSEREKIYIYYYLIIRQNFRLI